MAQIQGDFSNGAYSTTTQAQPQIQTPHSDIVDLYKELMRRRAMSPAPMASGGGSAPPVQIPTVHDERGGRLAAARENDELQDLAYRQRLREIDLNPPKKYITGGAGYTGGYIDDPTVLPLHLRPQNSAIQHGPQDVARAQGQFGNDQAFQAKLEQDRLNSYYGRQ